jgi:hypothetical protein
MNQERPIKILQALVILLLCFPPPLRAATGDDFIRGYASAVLEREFGLKNFSLNGAREAVTVTSGELTPADYDKVIAALSSIDGVKRVLIFDSRGVEVATSSAQSSAAQRSMAERLPAEYEVGFLPGGNLFEPLIADPRWPRFGGTYLVHRDPSDLKPWSTQGGIEVHTPWRFWGDSTRFVTALDLQNREENKWSTEVSVRGGLQFERAQKFGRRISLLVEYYNGHSPNGQFFNRKVEYFGPGLHLDF